MPASAEPPRLVISHLTLRKAIGVMGILLPVILAVGCVALQGCDWFQNSISDYYATEMRDVLVGILFAIGWFLFSYRGYERKDDVAGDIACVCAMGVALFPNSSPEAWIRVVHFASAACLFSVLAYFSLALFTKSKPGVTPTPEKLLRNTVYRICGITILLCIAAIAVYSLLLSDTGLNRIQPVYWLESFALWAFGLSWIVKGEMLLKDG